MDVTSLSVEHHGTLFRYLAQWPGDGDIVADAAQEPFRRRSLGSFLVEPPTRVCYGGVHVPASRCKLDNLGSRCTLQKAGFVPYGQRVGTRKIFASTEMNEAEQY